MKLWYNQKEKTLKLKLEAPEEVFVLAHFISPGALVTAESIRSKEIVRDGRKIKVGKEKIRLTIEAEKTEIKEDSLKILGKIIESSKEVSGYHSITLSPGSEAVIKKEWKDWEIEKLRKFAKPQEKVLACVLDEKEAYIYTIGDKIEERGRVFSNISKAAEQPLKGKYFSEIAELLKGWEGKIIVAGPGFVKEEFFKYLKEHGISEDRIFLDAVSHTGIVGVKELMNRGTLERVLKESRIAEESREVERVFEEVAKDGLVVYGEEDVKKAIELGALEKLLISTKLVSKYRELVDEAEKTRAKIMFISDSHPEGERFYHFCGIAGFLRFRI